MEHNKQMNTNQIIQKLQKDYEQRVKEREREWIQIIENKVIYLENLISNQKAQLKMLREQFKKMNSTQMNESPKKESSSVQGREKPSKKLKSSDIKDKRAEKSKSLKVTKNVEKKKAKQKTSKIPKRTPKSKDSSSEDDLFKVCF